MATPEGPDRDTPVYVISVAAELAGMHAQTLRQYDRLGLVTPSRTRGGGRRYSARDIDRLREVQALSADGVSLAGIHRILGLETQVEAMRNRLVALTAENQALREALGRSPRVFAAGLSGEVVTLRAGTRPRGPASSSALAVWRPQGWPFGD
ncbi:MULTISPECIES: heat shock protein transcriptional repressor HspR [unclassified Ornithinimicrobium]|uniref:heat shock protein transcriptional repressor HspR n=1 Tax=unclassified Ornithinimicrobium TaxID=2615080 RepID=UPI0038544B0E